VKPTRYTPEMIDERIERGIWQTTTLSDFWDRNAKNYPHKEAIVDSKTRLTWAQAKQWIDRIALGFLELGIKKDESIVIQVPNSVEFHLLRIACEKAGILCLPVLRSFRYKEMEYVLSYVEAVGVVIPWQFKDFDHFQMIEGMRPNLPLLRHMFVIGDKVPLGAISLKEMSNRPIEEKYPPNYLERTKCKATEVSLILPTTGTTGFPKFVEFAMCLRLYHGKKMVENMKVTGDDVLGSLGPGSGLNVLNIFGAPQVGAKVCILEESFEPEKALNLFERERVTYATLAPAMLAMIVRHPNFKYYDLSSLRLITCGGGLLPYPLAEEAEEKMGCPITQVYASVDVGASTMTTPDDPFDVRVRTVGRGYGGNEVKLVGDDGREVPKGESGEIWLSGPATVSGYYKNPEATWQAWTEDGWFKMGDLGKLDDQGNLIIVGRKKDIIIRGGQNIYPGEIENILISHPKVSTVAIVPMPDPVMVEKACAYIVPKSGQTFTFNEMVSYLKKEGIASYKVPERLELLDKLPMLAEGQKVDKKSLQQDIVQKLKAEGKV